MRRWPTWLLCVFVLSLPACAIAPIPMTMNVTAYPDPEESVALGTHFCTVPLGNTTGGPMLEKNLLFLVKERLVAQGLIYDEAHPQMLVGLTGYIGPFDQYVPPSTFYWSVPKTETSRTTGSAWGSDGSSAWGNATTTTQSTERVPITTGGYSITQYYRNISVLMAKLVPSADSTKVNLVWSGSVQSSGSTGDLLTVAPTLLDELLGEFPQRSGKPSTRTVEMRVATPPAK